MRYTALAITLLIGCVEPSPTEAPDAGPPLDASASVQPRECALLAAGAPDCCRTFCNDVIDFDAQCAPANVCIVWVCPLVDGGLIIPEACGPAAPASTCGANKRARERTSGPGPGSGC